MGREASGSIRFGGQSGAGKLLLEPGEIILRGSVRAHIPRDQITGYQAEGEDLLIQTANGLLRATLGAKEAAQWVRALAKPLPDLAQKLGIKTGMALWVIGPLTDAALIAAVANHGSANHGVTDRCDAAQPALLLAELPDQAAFDAALVLCHDHPTAAFWGITRKGKSAFPDAALRAQMRTAGYIDSKSCAVSDGFTATRYSRRRAKPPDLS